jgi:hypothetical protein
MVGRYILPYEVPACNIEVPQFFLFFFLVCLFGTPVSQRRPYTPCAPHMPGQVACIEYIPTLDVWTIDVGILPCMHLPGIYAVPQET